jgi:gas vesicle protein
LLVGAVIGGALALLLTPKSGMETRTYIKDKLARLRQVRNGKISGDYEYQLVESEEA